MNSRQQQMIDQLVKEFDRLNSFNLNGGSIVNVDAYREEFNEAEMIKKETELYNDSVRIAAEKLFLDQAYLLQNDLHKLGIKTIVEDNSNKKGFHSRFRLYYNHWDQLSIYLNKQESCITSPNGGYIKRTDKFVVEVGKYKFNSLRDMAENSNTFKNFVRIALEYANKNN